MSPETFHDLLDHATETAPPAPLPRAAVTAGHRRLRRRRLAAGAATTALAVVVGGLWSALPGGAQDQARDPGFTSVTGPVGDGQILDTCLGTREPLETGEGAVDALQASGTPRLMASVRTDAKIMAAIESADGSRWASCWIWRSTLERGEPRAGLDVYDAVEATGGGPVSGWALGSGCVLTETQRHGCDTWSLSVVDRPAAAVAAVRYDLGDGTSVTVPVRNGYVVLNVQHPVPPGGSVDRHGEILGFDWGRQMTYLAADGTPIAAGRLGMGDNDVPGLAPLSDYPSIGRYWKP